MTTSMMTKFIEAMGGTVEVCTHEFGVTGALFVLHGITCQMTAFRNDLNIFVLEGEEKGKIVPMPVTVAEFTDMMTKYEMETLCAV